MKSVLVQTSLKFIGRKPVRRVFVIEPPFDRRLIICVVLATKLKQKCRHFRLFGGRKRGQFFFQIHDTHALHLIPLAGFRKREMLL